MSDLAGRIVSQWERLSGPPIPADFTYDRNGLRLGIAALEDELREVYEVWAQYKKNLQDPVAAASFRHELLDIAAVAMLMYRNVPSACACKGTGNA